MRPVLKKSYLLLHVGLPKTFSSSLQNSFFPKIFDLKKFNKTTGIKSNFDLKSLNFTQNQKILTNENFFINFRPQVISKNLNFEKKILRISRLNNIKPIMIILYLNKPSSILKSGYLHITSKSSIFSKTLSFKDYLNCFSTFHFPLDIIIKKIFDEKISLIVVDTKDEKFNIDRSLIDISDYLYNKNILKHKWSSKKDTLSFSNISPKNYISYNALRLEKSIRKYLIFLNLIVCKISGKNFIYDKLVVRDFISLTFNQLNFFAIKFNDENNILNEFDKSYERTKTFLSNFEKKGSIYYSDF